MDGAGHTTTSTIIAMTITTTTTLLPAIMHGAGQMKGITGISHQACRQAVPMRSALDGVSCGVIGVGVSISIGMSILHMTVMLRATPLDAMSDTVTLHAASACHPWSYTEYLRYGHIRHTCSILATTHNLMPRPYRPLPARPFAPRSLIFAQRWRLARPTTQIFTVARDMVYAW
jgi:hypothetical protein